MFNCYLHGWSSPSYLCPECYTTKTATSNSSLDVIGEKTVDIQTLKIKHEENEARWAAVYEDLETKLAIAVEALEFYASVNNYNYDGADYIWDDQGKIAHKALAKIENK